MDCVLKGGLVFAQGAWRPRHIGIQGGRVTSISEDAPTADAQHIDCTGCHVFPGFTDVHVHLREPGFSYKETIRTGTLAAARGGYTAVVTMPNLKPVPDSLEALEEQLKLIRRDALVTVLPLGAITRGEQGQALADMAAMAPHVVGYSDDGRGVQDAELMRRAMLEAKRLQRVIAAHCEDERYPLGAINDSAYARAKGLSVNDPRSEWKQVERDIELLRQTGAPYHVCHVSTKESLALIRAAKAEGLDISCETAPHYLLLDDEQLRDEGGFRMNPPIRSPEDREALVAGLIDGSIDMIATDHAPHSEEEKAGGLAHSMNGIVGLETAFPLLYTHLVRRGLMPLEALIDRMHDAPNRRFHIPTALKVGEPANLSIWDLGRQGRIDPAQFRSLGRSMPFAGWPVWGACLATFAGGRLVYTEDT